VSQPFDMVVRRFEVAIGDQDQVDLQASFDLGDV
jgi:hypothetical protein